jgi:predicted RNA polymerase sigma factor
MRHASGYRAGTAHREPCADDAQRRSRRGAGAGHPILSPEARVALTLRLIGGLTTAEIARAFLSSEAAIAQRIVRAKAMIAKAGLAFEVPAKAERAQWLASVLAADCAE